MSVKILMPALSPTMTDGNLTKWHVKEGDLITFPAYLLHTSEKNKDGRKTVIAFNSDFIYD